MAAFVFRCCSARVLLCRRGLVHKVRQKGQKLRSYPPNLKMRHQLSLFFPSIMSSQSFFSPPHCCVISLLLSHVLIFHRFNKTSLTLLENFLLTSSASEVAQSYTNTHLNTLRAVVVFLLRRIVVQLSLKLLSLMHLTSCRIRSCWLFSLPCLSSFSHAVNLMCETSSHKSPVSSQSARLGGLTLWAEELRS